MGNIVWIQKLDALPDKNGATICWGMKERARRKCMPIGTVVLSVSLVFTFERIYIKERHLAIVKEEDGCFSVISVSKRVGEAYKVTQLGHSEDDLASARQRVKRSGAALLRKGYWILPREDGRPNVSLLLPASKRVPSKQKATPTSGL